ncbi:MAG: threonine ammonia-lyase IlvA [Candidatus Woesearchaeota archaeon]
MKQEIENARKQFPEIIKQTPLEYNHRLSKMYNCNVYLKREDMQIVRSYKIRGAYNRISQLSTKERENGVICASAGNHAQGFALACHDLGINGTVVMPRTTPLQKIERTQSFGRNFITVELIGDTYDEAYAHAQKVCSEKNVTFIHPFNDVETIKGQGTVAYEIVTQLKETDVQADYIFIPVGGGGLIAGCAHYFKETIPSATVIAVEPQGAPGFTESLKKGEVVTLNKIDSFVDGAAVRTIGDVSFNLAKEVVSETICVPEGSICSTILAFLKEEGIIIEPAGALSVDALNHMRGRIQGKTVVCIVSGGNFDFERLPEIKERSLRYEGLRKYYVVMFPQRPGALREFLNLLGEEDDIIRFEYLKKTSKERGPALVGLQTKRPENFTELHARLTQSGISFEDVTNDEMYYDLLI